ncbi:MAG: hypothetical protein ACI8RA_002154, partial [Chlamydiales bacterium]
SLFKGIYAGRTISEMKEYKQIQQFYRAKIAAEVNEEKVLEELMNPLELAVRGYEEGRILERDEMEEALEDLDVVKQDLEYEFFFLKREDGERFFNRTLLRNIKLACDFGEDVDFIDFSEDPLIYIKNWQDKDVQVSARHMIQAIGSPLEDFYAEALKYREMTLASMLNRTIMALMLAANPKNLLRHSSVKSCYSYFGDFQRFLRLVLHSKDYHKLMAYPPDKSKKFLQTILDLTHALCKSLYTHTPAKQELGTMISNLLEQDSPKFEGEEWLFADKINNSFCTLEKLLKRHPNGPLFKVFDLLQEENIPIFDTLFLDNIPYALFEVYSGDHKMSQLRLPSPTSQEYLERAAVSDEFKGLLRSYGSTTIQKRHLLFNLQDRTSWKEHSRCNVLEELPTHAEYSSNLTVVTFAMDTEFYFQLPPYRDLDDAGTFMEQFKEHLASEQAGFYFPRKLKDILFPHFVDSVMEFIHKYIFDRQTKLNRKERLVFIDALYLFLQVKIMEIVNPDSISMTCKDSVDVGSSATGAFFAMLKIMSGNEMTEEDYEQLNIMLFVPPLLIRERSLNRGRLQRMVTSLRAIQKCLCDLGTGVFSKAVSKKLLGLFDENLFKLEISLPTVEERV